ncbi:DeoR/GlpR family DNA-binding transcription regulator [Pullulanibacillus sp. KACC 23026]|uniref:DeoR/GlpR family DNA-binding transcription regulator n=1 Tax=Pullulanibacillus sp. KACC 23026 TaxID=3028315 RepID=UPI0023AF03D6|nr:DeoR/GlpR family DNA-binding transcription regulator [Pullulanibacillus sp. KACC 23026]WEG12457.1 DeoR/GlpR family DNA-binding transcription regulator [Pullulanibacillus sp. KACC 23026]
MKMFVMERRKKILELLEARKRLTVNELADSLVVSEATLRSDLNNMEKEGLLTRTHGGAILNENTNSETSFSARQKRNQKEKVLIAKEAVQFIKEKQCILLDASSTALELAHLLKQLSIRITIVTSSAAIALELNESPEITVILIGGMMTKGASSVEGTLGLNLVDQFNIDIMFTSANGFTPEAGLTDFNLYEVQLKSGLVNKAHMVIALLDHTKIGSNSSAVFAETNQIDIIITDREIDNKMATHPLMETVKIIVAK